VNKDVRILPLSLIWICGVLVLGHTAMVEMLISKTKAWEDDRGIPFMFDGVHLLFIGLASSSYHLQLYLETGGCLINSLTIHMYW
jgi:hypothetical protein